MWARKRIDITTRDLGAAIGYCASFRNRRSSRTRGTEPTRRAYFESEIADCFGSDASLVCFSVRSGFDLMLQSVDWPTGAEIIFSGLTIADMPRIAKEHGFVPLGTEICAKTMAPDLEDIELRITPQTRAIVLAHLFGGRCSVEGIAEIAHRHGLLLIEDCAQAYVGNHDRGASAADVSMFSFGAIKTNTSLGGAVLIVRRPDLRLAMETKQWQWPSQSNFSFAKRVAKYACVKLISTWPCAAFVRQSCLWGGSNHDWLAANMAKGFSGPGFFDRIRRRPSLPLLQLMVRRLQSFRPTSMQRRAQRGDRLSRMLTRFDLSSLLIGVDAINPTHWVFAVLVDNPQQLVEHLWRKGFDATTQSSLVPVESYGAPIGANGCGSDYNPPDVASLLNKLVFLPLDLPMPEREIDRMGKAIFEVARPIPEMVEMPIEGDPDPMCEPLEQIKNWVDQASFPVN